MRDFRSDFEKEVHVLVIDLLDILAKPMILKARFTSVMGHLRDARVHLDNKAFGCKSGLHASQCLCEDGIEKPISSLKREASKRKGV